MTLLWQDIRYALRVLGRRPSFGVVAVLTLALGIGATSAMFTVINTVLLEPLPYPAADRVMRVMEVNERGRGMQVSDPNFEDLRDQSRSFAYLAQYAFWDAAVLVGREPLRTGISVVSAPFFDVIGVHPIIGRRFLPEESHEEAPGVAIVSYGFWQRRLGGAEIAGAAVRVDGVAATVVGVLPPGFAFPADVDVWIPREQQPGRTGRTGRNYHALGRLAGGVSIEQARAELSTIARRLKQQYGDDTSMVDAAVSPLQEELVGQARPALLIQLGAVGFLLLVACANVLNLLLAQAAARHRELAVRTALGAGRWRLARQFVTETGVISATGATLGLFMAMWSTNALRALAPAELPRVGELRLGLPVVVFTVALAVVVTLAIGLVAAYRATSQNVQQALREERGGDAVGSRRVRDGLVVLQVAVTVVLLVGSGLLVRSLLRLVDTTPGFRTSQIATLRLFQAPVPSPFGDSPVATDPAKAQRGALLDRIVSRLGTLPGVRDVGLVNRLPLEGAADGTFGILGPSEEIRDVAGLESLFDDPSRTGSALYVAASEGYFRAMGIPLRGGRLFDARDTVDRPHVAVISESLARTRWPDRDPIGLRLEFGNMDGDLRPLTIVGIVGDVRLDGLDAPPPPVIYTCHRQRPQKGYFAAVMHTDGTASDLAEPARRVLTALDPETPVEFHTMETVLARWLAWRRLVLLLLGLFASLALLLSVAGVYGALAYRVTERTREIGIRAALGAARADLLRLVLGHGARLLGVGLVAGAGLALALTGLLQSLLYGVAPWDPVTFFAVSLVLAAVALVASYVPARRATRVDPMVALRTE